MVNVQDLLGKDKFALHGYVYETAGSRTRVASELTQVLFAPNRVYFTGKKRHFKKIDSFDLKPSAYSSRISAVLFCPGENVSQSVELLEGLVMEVVGVAHPW